jgi:hypothetical protein
MELAVEGHRPARDNLCVLSNLPVIGDLMDQFSVCAGAHGSARTDPTAHRAARKMSRTMYAAKKEL